MTTIQTCGAIGENVATFKSHRDALLCIAPMARALGVPLKVLADTESKLPIPAGCFVDERGGNRWIVTIR